MSSKKLNIFDSEFDSYGEAFSKYLECKNLTPKWLAEEIIERFGLTKPKVESLQSMISRWAKGDDVSRTYQERIDSVLDITIKKNNEGKWIVSRTENKSPSIPGARTPFTLDQLLKEERSRLGIEDIPDTERGRELQGMLDDAVSLVLKLRRSIEKEKRNHSDE